MTVRDKVLELAEQAGYVIHRFARDDNSVGVADINGTASETERAINFYTALVNECCQLFLEKTTSFDNIVITPQQAAEIINNHFMTHQVQYDSATPLYMADCYQCRVKEVEFPRRVKKVTESLHQRIAELEADAEKYQALVDTVIRCGRLQAQLDSGYDGGPMAASVL